MAMQNLHSHRGFQKSSTSCAKTRKTSQYGYAYSFQGTVYNYLGNDKQALKYKLKSLEVARKVGDRGEIGTSLHNLGAYYMNISNLDEAKKQFIEALKYETDKSSLASTYNYLFVLYRQQGDMQKAIENSQKAIQYAKDGGDFVRFPHVTQ